MKTSKSHIAQMCISIDHQITRAKDAFEYFIRDKSMPLEVRWDVFKESPSYLKNHEGWYFRFECLKEVYDINWYEDAHAERYSIVDLVEFIDDDYHALKEGCEYVAGWKSLKVLEDMMEEVMEKNIGSFKYDW